MGILDRFIRKDELQQSNVPSTSDMFIGNPEAESEATTAPIRLTEFFEDYLDVFNSLNNEKFIVVGRKGSGKTAIGEAIFDLARNEPNVFCKFIKKTDIDVEQIVQIGASGGLAIEISLLYKWLILTHLLVLITENEKLSTHPAMTHLRKFVNRNRGFIDIRKDEIKETVTKEGLNVGVEYLNRAVSVMGGKEMTAKGGKADFTKLLPNLEWTIINLLKSDPDNQYILIFDDLDVNYSTKSQSSIDTMSELLRMVKYFNIDCLGRNGIDSKVLVLLRDDIVKSVIFSADMGKIINGYAVELNWYEDLYKKQENKLRLRKFINKRIAVNFAKKRYVINDKNDPWTSFVDERSFWGEKSGFKYIIDFTFYRPRDLVLFFKDISYLNLPLPLSNKTIKTELLGRYSVAMVRDIKGELSILYDSTVINSSFDALRAFGNRAPFSYNDLQNELINNGISKENTSEIIQTLFDYSLIGNFELGNVSFKFREGAVENIELDKSKVFILHYLLQAYFKFN